jgi:hypothetical protein
MDVKSLDDVVILIFLNVTTEKQCVEMVYARFEENMAYVSCEVSEKGHLVVTTNGGSLHATSSVTDQ